MRRLPANSAQRALLVAGVGLAACSPAGEAFRLEEDESIVSFLLVEGERSGAEVGAPVAILGPFLGSDETTALAIADTDRVFRVAWTRQAFLRAAPRADLNRLSDLAWTPAPDELNTTCRDGGIAQRPSPERDATAIQWPAGRLVSEAVVQELRDEGPVSLEEYPHSLDAQSLIVPITPCLPGRKLTIESLQGASSFIEGSGDGERDEPQQLARVDEGLILFGGRDHVVGWRIEEDEPAGFWNTRQSGDALGLRSGERFDIGGFDVDLSRWPDHAGVLVLGELRRRNAQGSFQPQGLRVYALRYDGNSFSDVRLLATATVSQDHSVLDLKRGPNGSWLGVGDETLVTSTSSMGPFVFHDIEEHEMTRSIWTRAASARHAISGRRGEVWRGDAHFGLAGLEREPVFPVTSYVYGLSQGAIDPRLFVSSDAPEFATLEGSNWRHFSAHLPSNALMCAPELDPCGWRRLDYNSGNDVRAIEVIDDLEERTTLLMAADRCSALFLIDPEGQCASAFPLNPGEQIGFLDDLHFRRLNRSGDDAIAAGPKLNLREIHIEVSAD